MKNLPSDKVPASEIPTKILEESIFCFPELKNYINESLTSNNFPDTLKLSEENWILMIKQIIDL